MSIDTSRCNPCAHAPAQGNAENPPAQVDGRRSTSVTLPDLLRSLAGRLAWAKIPATEGYTVYLNSDGSAGINISLSELRRLEDDGGPPAAIARVEGHRHLRLQRAGIVFTAVELAKEGS